MTAFTDRVPRRRLGPVGAAVALVTAAALAAGSVALALSSSATGDYLVHGAVGGDNAGPAIAALIHGNLHAFFARQPFMGLTSLLLRAPFVALASLFGHGNTFTYSVGAAACLFPAGLLAVWMLLDCRSWRRWLAPASAALILFASPLALDAIQSGHPEEMLASALATAAVLAAIRGRNLWAAVLVGLAAGTKQWAVIAIVPVLLAQRDRRIRTLVLAAALALVLSAVAPLADLAAFSRAGRAVGSPHTANVASAWWPISSSLPTPAGATVAPTARRLPLGLTRSDALLIAFLLASVTLVALARSWKAGAWRRVDPLALLALVGLIRCIGDPGDLHYYGLAALVPLTVWEVSILGRAPLTGMVVVGAAALTFGSGGDFSPGLTNGLVLAWMVGIGCYLARRALLGGAVRHPPPVSVRAQAQTQLVR